MARIKESQGVLAWSSMELASVAVTCDCILKTLMLASNNNKTLIRLILS